TLLVQQFYTRKELPAGQASEPDFFLSQDNAAFHNSWYAALHCINSNVAQRTSSYGMLRFLGPGRNQVRMLVRLVDPVWGKTDVP
ncbi:hypothetical protein, partial [Faecalibacterium duncaniae]|uniref:hypothetical protein n=1 Tax=Faecalibacterium duncaniae (strain DSM 17677 / JCM 31915 / A2-165) TaxID=411483 RepID=UPI002940E4B7